MITYCHENKSPGFRIVDASASRPFFSGLSSFFLGWLESFDSQLLPKTSTAMTLTVRCFDCDQKVAWGSLKKPKQDNAQTNSGQ